MLICGPRGTGKTVLARSIEDISGGRSVISLPLGSTEDQVFGGLDVERTIHEGVKALSPSLLQRADGNILYADNVNLLPEHIVHQVLNAAEDGCFTVERDGISESFPTSFLFLASMDPDEGGLSDHILDRFDICVFLKCIDDEDERVEMVVRCMRFQRDPAAFIGSYAQETALIRQQVSEALGRSRFTRIPEGYCGAISEVCRQLNVSGHRGDIAVMNAARALAALDGRETANLDDLREAAAMCLEHRRNDSRDEERGDRSDDSPEEGEGERQDPGDGAPDEGHEGSGGGEAPQGPGSDGDGEPPQQGQRAPDRSDGPPAPDPGDAGSRVFEVGDAYEVIDYLQSIFEDSPASDVSSRRKGSAVRGPRGRCVGSCIPVGRPSDIALSASIRAAAPYQVIRDHSDLAVVLRGEDLRQKVREMSQGNDILFLVDGSGSIGAQKRMVAVKGAILSMLRDAYQNRDRIGMVVFRMDAAEEILPLTKSTALAYHVLQEIPTGGRTPLTRGLLKGYEVLRGARKGARPVMVILSDGRCNVSFTPGKLPVDEMMATARSLSETGIRFIVIDTEAGRLRFGLALELSRALDGAYLRLEDLNAEHIERSVRKVMGG